MNINGNKISILGAVRSGISAAKLALANGAIPFVSDLSENEIIKGNCDILKNYGIKYETGVHSSKVFECDYIVTSPGVPTNSPVLAEAIDKGIKVISEVEFASWFCKGNIIAITGTNGKTTTASLCSHVINSTGLKSFLAGNIGLPFSEITMSVEPDEFVSLEVSSFQLDFIDQFKPKFSVLLNISNDHLDRYENRFDLYIKSKMKIVQNQGEGDTFIFNGDDGNIPIGYVSANTSMFGFSLDKSLSNGSFIDEEWILFSKSNKIIEICHINDLSIKGEHNIQNSLAVINVAMNIGIKPDQIKKSLETFKGVEHRLEFVREKNGVKFINDSKATNVDSVWYALRSFKEPIYLILGGIDKGNEYLKIKDEVKKRVKKVYAIGASAQKIYNYFYGITDIEIIDTLDNTIIKAHNEAKNGSVVLLSPACASFDMFKNYEDRGLKFKKIVNEIK
jgi:UDP-N-acetylmuramoylalanine--D-glutamate ligase